MTVPDTCCTLAPYFKIHQGRVEEFKVGCDAFSFCGEEAPQFIALAEGFRR